MFVRHSGVYNMLKTLILPSCNFLYTSGTDFAGYAVKQKARAREILLEVCISALGEGKLGAVITDPRDEHLHPSPTRSGGWNGKEGGRIHSTDSLQAKPSAYNHSAF
ncbi:hypothetical protein AVEN_34521-1 [Araneus ventricosus]|uniref:Uncharacterized protein n=1 Tax=Araneus ventricosus TaxID=182803 RepID=A0A4Y2RS73_ARAVE|nr:hypothetical protein AVEN_34521-1 [Araneus ventricosus]